MLMTIVVLLFENVVLEFLHGGLLHPPRFADDAAEDIGNALRAKRSPVLFADPVKDLLLALAVIDRQAGRFLDGRQFMRDPGPLVEQPEQLCIQGVYGFSARVEACIGVFIVRDFFRLRRFLRAAGGASTPLCTTPALKGGPGGCGPYGLLLLCFAQDVA